MKIRQWLACAALAWTNVSFAANPDKSEATLWQGELGTQRIVVERSLSFSGKSDCGGRYFYERYRLDIGLDGESAPDGGCLLEEMPAGWGRDQGKPQWRMRAPVGDSWQGEWVGVNGRKLSIRLNKVHALPDAREPSLSALRSDFDRYAYLRLSTLKLQAGKRETVNGYELRWLRQPDSDIGLFEVASGYSPTAQRAINRTLHYRLWQWVEDLYQCRSGGARPGDAGFDLAEATLRHIDSRVISASLDTSYYCGGAHPDFGDAPLNIDARNGRELRLEDVLWVGKGEPVHRGESPDPLDDAWMDYRSKIFAPWLTSQFMRLYPGEMAPGGTSDDNECDYRDPEVWNFSSWYVLPTGIHFAAYFPRVMRVCDDPEWAVLPWDVVNAHPGAVRLH